MNSLQHSAVSQFASTCMNYYFGLFCFLRLFLLLARQQSSQIKDTAMLLEKPEDVKHESASDNSASSCTFPSNLRRIPWN